MRRAALCGAAIVVVLSLVVTAIKVTQRRDRASSCPHCHAGPLGETLFPTRTVYYCRSCSYVHEGPARLDFSVLEAAENWLDP